MPKRKLTSKLKDFLYENRWKVKQSDYDGEALAYLKRLRAATKAAKKRREQTAIIGNIKIPRNSKLYELIEASAKLKKQPINKFIKENTDAIDELIEGDRIVLHRETSYAIQDINRLPKRSKIFINGEQVSKGDAIHAVQSLTSSAMQHTETVVLNYELSYDYNGNLYLDLPTEEEIEEAEDNPELYDEMLDDHEGLVSIKSPGKKK